MRSDLQIIDGHFFRNGVKVPPKFGDREQIDLLKRKIQFIEDLIEDGIPLGIDWQSDIEIDEYTFFCLCKNDVSINDNTQEIMCLCCGRHYKIIPHWEMDLAAKLIDENNYQQ